MSTAVSNGESAAQISRPRAPLGAVPDFFYQLFSYREYLVQSVQRDLRTKYKRSVLGYLWTMLHPLAMMAILSIVFANIMRMEIKDYAVFLFCAILPWNFFSSTVMMSLGSIRANSKLFSQIPVPKFIFSVSILCSNLFNYMLAIVPLIIVALVAGRGVPVTMLAWPIVVLPLVAFTMGVALILASSNVFFDDTLHLAEVSLQALYFLSPVLYHRGVLPAQLIDILQFVNPVFLQIEFLRAIFYDGALPNLDLFIVNSAIALLVLMQGILVFRKNEHKFLYFV